MTPDTSILSDVAIKHLAEAWQDDQTVVGRWIYGALSCDLEARERQGHAANGFAGCAFPGLSDDELAAGIRTLKLAFGHVITRRELMRQLPAEDPKTIAVMIEDLNGIAALLRAAGEYLMAISESRTFPIN